ncbi:alpha-2-macroglobulin, partial [Flaviaesturariibacter flavus]
PLYALELERLEFSYRIYTGENKDSLYVRALRRLIVTDGNGSNDMGARLQLARWYSDKARTYNPYGDTTQRWSNRAALQLLAPALNARSHPGEDWQQAYNLARSIQEATLNVQAEKVNLPGEALRFLLQYRNVGRVHLRLLAVPDAGDLALDDEDDWDSLYHLPAFRRWSQELPATGDAQQHRVELKVDALPAGTYILCATNTENFEEDSSVASGTILYVSNIAYMQQENRLWVMHRKTGAPLAGATVTVYQSDTAPGPGERIRRRVREQFTTDANGFVVLPYSDRYGDERTLSFRAGADSLFESGENDAFQFPAHDYYSGPSESQHVYFFTDRSIYRPGQTVYFKGIVTYEGRTSPELTRGYTNTVRLRDPNSQEKGRLEITTSDWGSFDGRFTLPESGLGGRFQLSLDGTYGYASISVEEYKRPKFEVRFDTLSGTYKAGGQITLGGKAIAYAGNAVGGAKVRYRVTRRLRPRWWWYGPALNGGKEIAHGEETTSADGTFKIAFTATPDELVDSATNPFWIFEATADVTDINGETRSGKQTATAGFKSIVLQQGLDARLAADSFRVIPATLTNTNGRPLALPVQVVISRLNPNRRLLRARYWMPPDQFVIDSVSFVRAFPGDPYRNEGSINSWPIDREVLRFTGQVKNGVLVLPAGARWEAGAYEVRLSTRDSSGREVTDIGRMELYRPGAPLLQTPLEIREAAAQAEPGTNAVITLESAAPLHLLYTVQRGGDIKGQTEISPLSGARSFRIPVTESDRGGLRTSFITVFNNRVYQVEHTISVPWTNKELTIETGTYRDKTLPGSTEQWRVRIRGKAGNRVAAELLASAYDASLDAFLPHRWSAPELWPTFRYYNTWQWNQAFSAHRSQGITPGLDQINVTTRRFDELIYSIAAENRRYVRIRGYGSITGQGDELNEVVVTAMGVRRTDANMDQALTGKVSGLTVNAQNQTLQNSGGQQAPPNEAAPEPAPQPRRNFNETAFFYPSLHTDSSGVIEFRFTVPESLTRWNVQLLGHTRELAFGTADGKITVQKDLMVQPGMPRFLRQGDHLELSTKVVNLSGKELTGQVQLELFDAATGTPVDGWFQNFFPNQFFTVAPGESSAVAFPVEVPYLYNSALTWRITARSGTYSDAEEATFPILSNKVLVTETMPLPMRGAGTKTFTFDKLVHSAGSESLQQHRYTIEYTANPAWYAVQALPYLMEYPYECAEQLWNRYYANALAAHILAKAPKVRAVFARWQEKDTAALLSNLQKNQELKSALLEETPWVMQAQNEQEQKRNLALLFDLARLAGQQESALARLRALQYGDGSFPWFAGGRSDRYVTQYIASGMGHLRRLGIDATPFDDIRRNALRYLDGAIAEDYLKKLKTIKPKEKVPLGHFEAQYLYARSFDKDKPSGEARTAFDHYLMMAETSWQQFPKRTQGMIALALHRYGQGTAPADILQSLRETAVRDEELGMYWKDNRFGYSWFWYHAPIETQALLVEAFSEIANDVRTADELRTWLIKNKQTQNWRTTTATADACYALLLQGTDWISDPPRVVITAGTLKLSSDTAAEAGTGYFKHTVPGELIRPEMGRVQVKVEAPPGKAYNAPSWGAVYWQYFEDMDKVTSAASPLRVERKLFREVNRGRGPELVPITSDSPVHVGDKVRVRLVLRTDRPMEYVHVKDLRPSCIEPVNVLSGYRWQDGLGYYGQTRDVSTNYFIDYLPRGTYVLEYSAFVTNKGQFSAGMATAQCLYAPEFAAHSERQQLTVE